CAKSLATVPCLATHLLNCIRSRIVLGLSLFRCFVTILPQILNSRSTPAPVTGIAKISRAILDNLGYIGCDFDHHFNGSSIILSRGLIYPATKGTHTYKLPMVGTCPTVKGQTYTGVAIR